MIRRFFTRLLLLVLIAACAWNWLQVQQLQAQVTQLQAAQLQAAHHVSGPSPEAAAFAHTPPARFGFPRLQARWNRLRHQASLFRLHSKKVFHEII